MTAMSLSTTAIRISLCVLLLCAAMAACQSCLYGPLGIDTDHPVVEAVEDVVRDVSEEIIEEYTGYEIELPDF